MRWTRLRSRDGRATSALWAVAFDRSRPRWFAGRTDLDGSAWRPLDGGGVEVGAGALRPDGCRGEVVDATGRLMRWDLRWDAGAAPFPYFPAPMERLAGGATYPIVAVPVARATGMVEVDGEQVPVEGALVEQSHLFGGRHAHRWGWLHALGFDEEPDGWATLVWARPQRLGGRVPPASSMALRAGGVESRAGGLHALRAVRWRDDGGATVTFTATVAGAEVDGEVTVPPDHLVGVTYHDPDGGEVYCDNTGVADLRLVVRRPGAAPLVRTCRATCAFERGGRVATSAWRPL